MTPQEQALDKDMRFVLDTMTLAERDYYQTAQSMLGLEMAKARGIVQDLISLKRQLDSGQILYGKEGFSTEFYKVVPTELLQSQAEKDRVMKMMAEALESAKEELWDCHSHCDPETSNNSDAMAWRDCRDALSEHAKVEEV